MPKKGPFGLKLDLLHPQSGPEKTAVRITRWLLSTGRFIIVFVEAIVLVAFVSRFKFDADLETTKEAAESQIPYIESLKNDEQTIRQTQLQLSTIRNVRQGTPDYVLILKKIADQTPQTVKITNIHLDNSSDKVGLKMTGKAQTNNDLVTLNLGLKSDSSFSEINITSVSLEQGVINFTITGTAKNFWQKGGG